MDNSFYMDDFYLGDIREDTISEVKKIIVQCPKEGPLPSCPLAILHELTLPEKLEIVESMPLEQLEGILLHHRNCLNQHQAAMNF